MQQTQPQSWTGTAITLLIVGVVLAIRMRRMGRMRRLRLERLWILPVLTAAVAVALYAALPPTGWGIALCAAALALGLAAGWQRGRFMHIAVDPDTHALNHRASPAALIFLLGLIAVRSGLKQAMAAGGADQLHLSAASISDALVAFALGLVTAQRVEMYVRGRRLLAAARAGGGTGAGA